MLYMRIATSLKYGLEADGYLRAWSYWKERAGLC